MLSRPFAGEVKIAHAAEQRRCRNPAAPASSPVTQASRSRSGTSISRSNSSISASLKVADGASAKRPMIRSISRMPRCQARNRSLRRRRSSPSLERVVPVIDPLQRQTPGRAGRG